MTEISSRPTLSALDAALECARIADSKRAEDVVILDVQELILITDYFVICSGSNRRQIQTIADEIQARLKEAGVGKIGIEGYAEGRWVLMDYGDLVVHIFLDEVRSYYDLEVLWGDAPRVDIATGETIPPPAAGSAGEAPAEPAGDPPGVDEEE